MSYTQLTLEERYVIAHLKIAKFSLREIARRFGRHHSTIPREIKRNGPEQQSAFTVRYSLDDAWQLFWTSIFVGEFEGSSVPTGDVKTDGYSRTEISAEYKRKQLTFSFAIDNLFDERYEQFVG